MSGQSKSPFLEAVRGLIRVKHLSYRTEEAYINWIRRFILFHNKRHPEEMGADEVRAFLTHLAVEGNVAASTQNQALFALPFLYREVLKVNLPWLEEFTPARKSERVPVVLTREEVKLIIDQFTGTNRLIANLLYGSGLRLIEALRLRVKDLDFGYRQVVVRDGKGGKDRFTVMPTKPIEPLQKQLETAKKLHEQDLRRGLGRVEMPFALAGKYPNAETEFCWQYVFPSKSLRSYLENQNLPAKHAKNAKKDKNSGFLV